MALLKKRTEGSKIPTISARQKTPGKKIVIRDDHATENPYEKSQEISKANFRRSMTKIGANAANKTIAYNGTPQRSMRPDSKINIINNPTPNSVQGLYN